MDANWTKVDFQAQSKQDGLSELLQPTHEVFARELGLSLSAFLRCSVSVTCNDASEVSYGELQTGEQPACFASVVMGPEQRGLIVELKHSVLFPFVGIALGAKSGSFVIPERRPTDIELQIVNILFRLVLSEVYRHWSPLVKVQLETMKLEIEHSSPKAFQQTDPVLQIQFDVTVGEHTGQLSFVVAPALFAALIESKVPPATISAGSPETTLQMMLPAKVAVDVWLDGSQMRLRDLLQLRAGQVIKLDHPVERKAVCTFNGRLGFNGQIVSTGERRAFMIDEINQPQA